MSEPAALAYDLVFGSVTTPLADVGRVAGSRWAIDECLEMGNGAVD